MRILTLDAAGAECAVGLVDGDDTTERAVPQARGQSAVLAPLVEAILARRLPDLIAVTVGPGSFTGLRAALSLAGGLGLGGGIPVIGVGVAEALRHDIAARHPGRALWIALVTRPQKSLHDPSSRIFLETDEATGFAGCTLDALPAATIPVAIAGDAATAVATRLAARGADVALTDAKPATAAAIAAIAAARHAGQRKPLPLRPLYVDPPAVTRRA